MSDTIRFNFNNKILKATITGTNTPHNCGWDTITVTFCPGFAGLKEDDQLIALKFVADVVVKSLYYYQRAVSLSVKDGQKVFLKFLKNTRRFRQMGSASNNHGGKSKVYYGIVYPFDKTKGRRKSAEIIAKGKAYSAINNALLTNTGW